MRLSKYCKSESSPTSAKRFRVLHLNPGNLYGGIETALQSLSRLQFENSGFEFEFGVCFNGRHRDSLVASGSRVHNLGTARYSRPWSVWKVQHRLAKTLVAGRFDAIVTHGSWMHGIAARVVAKHGVPLVTWVHGIPSPKNRLDRQLIRWKPDLVIANSRHTARAMSAMLPESRIEVVYFPIEPPASSSSGEVRRRLRERLSLDESTCVILMASRMEEWKGHRVLIEAVDRLPLDRNFHVLIVGEPQKSTEVDYFDSLKKSAASGKHPQRIRFLGHRPDVRELMLAADIFCQPNTAPEPFGIVFIEALYAGLPIVTTGMGGGAEIVDATCGNLLDPGDTKALSDCLDEWIRFPARRNEFASHGPTRAHELCNPTKQFERLHSTISRVFISS